MLCFSLGGAPASWPPPGILRIRCDNPLNAYLRRISSFAHYFSRPLVIQVRATVERRLACVQPCLVRVQPLLRECSQSKSPLLGAKHQRCASFHEETSSFRRRHYDNE